MFDYKEFGKFVKNNREKLKLSCFDLAITADINYSALSNIERGNIIPTTKTIVAILNALNKSFSDFECMEDNSIKDTYKIMLERILNNMNKQDLLFLLNVAEIYKSGNEDIYGI